MSKHKLKAVVKHAGNRVHTFLSFIALLLVSPSRHVKRKADKPGRYSPYPTQPFGLYLPPGLQ